MHITWHGLSCVKLQTTTGSLLINPFSDTPAINMPKLKVDIVVTTAADDPQSNNVDRLQGEPFSILHPGEYEIADIFIYGISLQSQHTGFVINAEGLTIAHPGSLIADYASEEMEKFDGVDILFVPLTGSTIKQQTALISQVEPRMIIPIHYAPSSMKKAPADWAVLDAFAKEMGVVDIAPEQKIIVKQGKMPQDETAVVVLDIT